MQQIGIDICSLPAVDSFKHLVVCIDYFSKWSEAKPINDKIASTIKWLQWDSNAQPLSSKTNTQPFSQTNQMIELCCEYLSVQCIWLYVFIMSRTHFRVNPHSINAFISRNSLLETGAISEV